MTEPTNLMTRTCQIALGALILILLVGCTVGPNYKRPQVPVAPAGAGLVGLAQRVEEALRRQTGVLQSVLDNMADAVVVADDPAHVILRNRAAIRMFGPSGDEETPRQRAVRSRRAADPAGGDAQRELRDLRRCHRKEGGSLTFPLSSNALMAGRFLIERDAQMIPASHQRQAQ